MVKYSSGSLDAIFGALSDSTRRAILARLAQGDAPVTELASYFTMSLPAVSKHLGVLERAGLINRKKDGRMRLCRLQAAPLEDAAEWIQFYKVFWESRLDALDQYLDATLKEEETNGHT